jgi:hypothetical protein
MILRVFSDCYTEADCADYRRNVALSNVKAGYDLLCKHAFTIVFVPLAAALLVCPFLTCSSSIGCADITFNSSRGHANHLGRHLSLPHKISNVVLRRDWYYPLLAYGQRVANKAQALFSSPSL